MKNIFLTILSALLCAVFLNTANAQGLSPEDAREIAEDAYTFSYQAHLTRSEFQTDGGPRACRARVVEYHYARCSETVCPRSFHPRILRSTFSACFSATSTKAWRL